MSYLFSLAILIINTILWCIEWHLIVGYRTLIHEPLFYIGFGAFFFFNTFQFFADFKEQDIRSDEKRENDRLGVIVGIGASVLLALSILASLPIIRSDNPPILHERFHWAALAAFLWIVFGVFWVSWRESDNDPQRALSLMQLRKLKTAALTHSLGWAGTAAIMLINTISKK